MNHTICSVGEVMLECIHRMPIRNTTAIENGDSLALGGPVINLAWNLRCLGWDPKAICTIGSEYYDRLRTVFVEGGLETDGIQLMGHGVDTLVVFTEPTSHLVFTISFQLSQRSLKKWKKKCEK